MWVRSILVCVLGFALLVISAAVGAVLPLHPFAPNVVLPVLLYLAVSPDVSVVRGTVIAFVLGWLLDTFAGGSLGLLAFVSLATFLAVRSAGVRLFLRGPAFLVFFSFVASLVTGVTILALQAIFSPPEAFPLDMPATGWLGAALEVITGLPEEEGPRIGGSASLVSALLGTATTTALLSPLVFALARRADTLPTRRPQEAAAR